MWVRVQQGTKATEQGDTRHAVEGATLCSRRGRVGSVQHAEQETPSAVQRAPFVLPLLSAQSSFWLSRRLNLYAPVFERELDFSIEESRVFAGCAMCVCALLFSHSLAGLLVRTTFHPCTTIVERRSLLLGNRGLIATLSLACAGRHQDHDRKQFARPQNGATHRDATDTTTTTNLKAIGARCRDNDRDGAGCQTESCSSTSGAGYVTHRPQLEYLCGSLSLSLSLARARSELVASR